MQGQPANATAPADFGQAHGPTGLNNTRTATQSQPITFSASGAVPSGTVDQQSPDARSNSSAVAQINSQIRSLLFNMQGEIHAPSGIHTFRICLVHRLLYIDVYLCWKANQIVQPVKRNVQVLVPKIQRWEHLLRPTIWMTRR